MSNIVNKPLSTTLYLITKLPYSLKALNAYKRAILVFFFLLQKYLVSETMNVTRSRHNVVTSWEVWNNFGPSCCCSGQALQMLSPGYDPGTARASRRLETLFVKAGPARCTSSTSRGLKWEDDRRALTKLTNEALPLAQLTAVHVGKRSSQDVFKQRCQQSFLGPEEVVHGEYVAFISQVAGNLLKLLQHTVSKPASLQ